MAADDFQKLPGMPPRADLNSVPMPSVLDCSAVKRLSWSMGLLIHFFTRSGPFPADQLAEQFPARCNSFLIPINNRVKVPIHS